MLTLKQQLKTKETALNILIDTHGLESPQVARMLNEIGCFCSEMGEFILSSDYFQRSLKIWLLIYGSNDPEVATALNNIANNFYNQDNYDQAIVYCKKALEVQQNVYGEEPHCEIAETNHNIGKIYEAKRDYNTAISYYFDELNMLKMIHGEKHLEIVNSLENIATTYYYIHELDTSYNYYRMAFIMLQQLCNQKNPDEIASSSSDMISNIRDIKKALANIRKLYAQQQSANKAFTAKRQQPKVLIPQSIEDIDKALLEAVKKKSLQEYQEHEQQELLANLQQSTIQENDSPTASSSSSHSHARPAP